MDHRQSSRRAGLLLLSAPALLHGAQALHALDASLDALRAGAFTRGYTELMPIAADVVFGSGVRIFQPELVNLYGCSIGDGTRIGAFVEIQKNAIVGARCKISSHTFVCEGVTIDDEVFVGHGVMFINDRFPRATATGGKLQTEQDWSVTATSVERGASIGS